MRPRSPNRPLRLSLITHMFVHSFHFILMPFSPSNTYRLITIGRNLLPRRTESKGKRPDITWAKLLDVSDDLSTLKERLGPRTYETKTKGASSASVPLGGEEADTESVQGLAISLRRG